MKNGFLADTSVWINYLKNVNNRQTDILTNFISQDNLFFICPIIIQEILQGIREDAEYEAVKDALLSIDVLVIDPVEAAIGSADLYRKLRKKGITIKKSNDCLIAFYCIYFKIPLLHSDNDFTIIAKNSTLKIF